MKTPQEIIKEAREARGMSQRKVAELCGLTPGYIARIETDSLPSYAVAKLLANALELDLPAFWAAVEDARVVAEDKRVRTRSAVTGEPLRARGVTRARSIEPPSHTVPPATTLGPEEQATIEDLKVALGDHTLRRSVIDAVSAFARIARQRRSENTPPEE